MIGRRLAQYRILELLGRGGMGEVYAAEDTRLHRRVALKVLPAEVSGDAKRRSRFERLHVPADIRIDPVARSSKRREVRNLCPGHEGCGRIRW